MNMLGERLDDLRAAGEITAEDRRRAAEAWQLTRRRPEERLLDFDRWVRIELAVRLDWAWAGAAKEKRIEQCRVALERAVLDLWRRGWLLDGARLAKRLTDLLDAVGAYQRKGAVRDFWSYFNASVARYVGQNAEEIQAEAMRAGSHIGQLVNALNLTKPAAGPTLPELMAQRAAEVASAKEETLRERMTRARRRKAACKAAADQPQLF